MVNLRAGVLWLFSEQLHRTKEDRNSNAFATEHLGSSVIHLIIFCCWVRYDWSKGKAGHCLCSILKNTVAIKDGTELCSACVNNGDLAALHSTN